MREYYCENCDTSFALGTGRASCCPRCGGEDFIKPWNKWVDFQSENAIAKTFSQNIILRRMVKRMRRHLKNMEKGILWRNALIDDLEHKNVTLQADLDYVIDSHNLEGWYGE